MNHVTTLKDVAREAGLSIAAVSKALNGYPHVSEMTRKRVLEVSDRLGYQPRSRSPSNHNGSTNGRQARIGLMMLETRTSLHFVNRWIWALTEVAKERGVRLELGEIPSQHGPRCESELRRHANGIDGLLLYGYVKAPVVQIVRQLRMPVVILGDVEPGQPRPFHQVCMDAQGMASYATRMLLAAGHRRVGFFCPSFPEGGWLDQWLAGYQLAMLRSEAGLDPKLWRVFSGLGQYEVGIEAARYMSSVDDPPTAYVLPEVNAAASFRHSMASRGIELDPRQVVLGGDPDAAAERGMEAYPVISERTDQAAAYAMDLLCRLSRGETTPEQVIVPYRSHHFHVFDSNPLLTAPSRGPLPSPQPPQARQAVQAVG